MPPSYKSLFELPDDVTYLNAAAQSPLLKTSHAAGLDGLNRKYQPWAFDATQPQLEAERLRGLFGGLIGATADDIAIVGSTAYAIATAARNLDLGSGQAVVVLEQQFPSDYYVWRQLADEQAARLVIVARPDNGDWTTAVLETLNRNTAIAALPPCLWTDGGTLDLVAIGHRCRELGVALVVDATQAVGAMPLDVNEIQPDFLACSAYKWLLGPYTLGFLYAAPHRQSGTPLEFHHWNHGNLTAVGTPIPYADDLSPGARRYDMGERNNLINLPIAIAGLEQVTEWTPAMIQETLSELTAIVAEQARKRGWRVPPDAHRVGHIIGVTPPGGLPGDLLAKLANERVFTSQRGDGLRISPYLYNEADDIARLFEVLDGLLA